MALVKIDTEKSQLQTLSGVLSVEHNCYVKALESNSSNVKPNDPRYSRQWFHNAIQTPEAWNVSTGSKKIIVAISDTGVDYNHEDLKDSMWINIKERDGLDGVDDDNNGCIDDIYGCDTADNDGDPIPFQSHHGTHVAGIVGAQGNNNIGVTGINWNVQIMAVKGFPDGQETTTVDALIKSIYYAVDNGADMINCSWGYEAIPSQAEIDAFKYARDRGVMVFVAAGNDSKDAKSFSPASISFVTTVASSTSQDALSDFSNYGDDIDIMAPGGNAGSNGHPSEDIYSLGNNGSYVGLIGTSMATPVVTGVAALIKSVNPDLSIYEVEKILFSSADSVEVETPTQGSQLYSRVNASQAVLLAELTVANADIGGNCSSGATNCAFSGSTNLSSLTEASPLQLNALQNLTSGCGNAPKPIQNQTAASFSNPQYFVLFFILSFPVLVLFLMKKSLRREKRFD